jgi:hypothetical protein
MKLGSSLVAIILCSPLVGDIHTVRAGPGVQRRAVACAGNQRLIRDLTMALYHLLLQLRVGALVPKAPVLVIREVVCAFETNPTYAEGTSANREISGRAKPTSS